VAMLEIDKSRCIGCGACVVECPVDALDLVDGIVVVNHEKCIRCGKCVRVCPANALNLEREGEGAQPEKRDPDAGARHEFSKEQAMPKSVTEYAAERPKDSAGGKGPAPETRQYRGVWVLIEHSRGQVAPVSWELLGEGAKLAQTLKVPLAGVLLGSGTEEIIPEVFAYGAEELYVVDNPILKDYRTEPYARGIVDLVNQYKPEIILFGATTLGRDLSGAVATELKTGLTADCTVLGVDQETGLLQQTRPAFGGNIMATILCRKHRPQMATVRPRVMAMPERKEGNNGKVIKAELHMQEAEVRTQVVDFVQGKGRSVFLDKAEIIVAVGKGLGNKKNLAMVEELVTALGATLAGTRQAVEAGWLSHEHQVGQTGATVRPKVYFAIGISGAIQHLVGMETSDCIIAINNDPEAPIFKVANYGLVGDLFQLVPALTAEFSKRMSLGLGR
jgi:electron transfer flavoprotein alpha subunit